MEVNISTESEFTIDPRGFTFDGDALVWDADAADAREMTIADYVADYLNAPRDCFDIHVRRDVTEVVTASGMYVGWFDTDTGRFRFGDEFNPTDLDAVDLIGEDRRIVWSDFTLTSWHPVGAWLTTYDFSGDPGAQWAPDSREVSVIVTGWDDADRWTIGAYRDRDLEDGEPFQVWTPTAVEFPAAVNEALNAARVARLVMFAEEA